MQRIFLIFPLLSLIVFSAACSKKPPQPPALIGGEVLSSLRSIAAAYEKKDLDVFMSGISRDFAERNQLRRSLSGVMGRYDSIRFSIQYTKMLVMTDEKTGTKVSFTWDAEWRRGSKTLKDGGRVTFVFDNKGELLKAIEGRNPFIPIEKNQ